MFLNIYDFQYNGINEKEIKAFETMEDARKHLNRFPAMYKFTLFKKQRTGEWMELDLSKPQGVQHEKTIPYKPIDDLPF